MGNRFFKISLIAVFLILGSFGFNLFQREGSLALAQVCKPVDVILVIDKSGSMASKIFSETQTKMEAAKESSNDFIDLLGANDHIGIVSFSDSAFLNQQLTDDKTLAKNAVDSLTPGGGTWTDKGINKAWNEFDTRGRVASPKSMIILTDGKPDSVIAAQNEATIAKGKGIKINVIGYDIGSTADPAGTRTILIGLASTPGDYYEAPTTANLQNIYNQLAAQMCDSNPPVIVGITRLPSGTVFSGDTITITSTAADNQANDWGLAVHRIDWTNNNWATTNSCDSGLTSGTKINNFNCIIGPFVSGTEIKYRSYAKDLALYETTSPVYSFQVATVTITSGNLIIDQPNTITVQISDPQGKADLDRYYVEIESPSSGPIKVSKSQMLCAGTGSLYDCSFDFTPLTAEGWGSTAKIIIYPWDGGLGFHNPAAQKIVNVILDIVPPIVSVSHSPDPVLNTDIITLTSLAADVKSPLQNQKIFYWINGAPQPTYVCNDVAPQDGKCDIDPSKNIGNFSINIGPYSVGTTVEYQAEATDTWANTASTSKFSFTVYSAECYNIGPPRTPKPNLTACTGGKCCAGICDTTFSCALDDECNSGETCSGTSWTCSPANLGANCSTGGSGDGCYTYSTGCGYFYCGPYQWDAAYNGCQTRDYSCDAAGQCVSVVTEQHCDECVGINLKDWRCSGNVCGFEAALVNCSQPGGWDNDGIACNCNCSDYDQPETYTCSSTICSDNKDNDCDGIKDCDEPECDASSPTTSISVYDSFGGGPVPSGGNIEDTKTNKVKLDATSFENGPCVTSPNILYEVKVSYKVDEGFWTSIFDCVDSNSDGLCDSDASKNINSFSVEIPVAGFSAGTEVSYKSEAVDNAPIPNTSTYQGYFNVISGDCSGKPDLTACAGGKCCAQICDTSYSCPLDSDCAGETCSGASWTCQSANPGAVCPLTLWTKYRPINIDNSSNPSNLADYQIKLIIPYDSDMRSDFGDLRFVDKNGDSLSHRTESTGGYIYAFRGDITADFWRYSNAQNSWTAMASAPNTVRSGGSLIYTGGDYIYALRGNDTRDFWRYSISGNSWVAMALTPSSVSSGGSLSYTGGDYIYALRGRWRTDFYRYSISGNSWSSMAPVPFSVGDGGSLVYVGGDYMYAWIAGNQTKFYRYSISGNSWSQMADTPAAVQRGSALTYAGGDYIYGLRGYGYRDFWRYSISNNSWSGMASTPGTVSWGGFLAYTGDDYIYGFRGNGTTEFWRYSISTNSWAGMISAPSGIRDGGSLVYIDAASANLAKEAAVWVEINSIPGSSKTVIYMYYGNPLATSASNPSLKKDFWTSMTLTPAAVDYGGSLAYTGGDYIYALRGGITTEFWRYSISGNSWISMASTPGTVRYGGSLAYTGGDYIYAFRGNNTTDFWRYSISGNSWELRTSTPSLVSSGAIAYTGGDYIYAFRGYNTTDFWRYSISGDSWISMASTPGTVNWGGSLAYTGGDYIYALRGNAAADFWRYSISNNLWSSMTSTPDGAMWSDPIIYTGGDYIYAFNGMGTDFWRYSISGNSWISMAPAPGSVSAGGSLSYTGQEYIYALRGNWTRDFWRYTDYKRTLPEPALSIGEEENLSYPFGCSSLDGGCQSQQGDPICESGYCNISLAQNLDSCNYATLVLSDYGCVGANCQMLFSAVDYSCDIYPPTVSIEARDNTDVLISDGGEVPPDLTDKITLSSVSFDNPIGLGILYSHQVQYQINSGGWITLYICFDTDSNGFCDDDDQDGVSFEIGENATINVSFLSGDDLTELKIGPFIDGDVVDYRTIATDTAQPLPLSKTVQKTFRVRVPNTPPVVTPLAPTVYPNDTDYWNGEDRAAKCWTGLQVLVSWTYSDPDEYPEWKVLGNGDTVADQSAFQVEVYNADSTDLAYLIKDSCNNPAPGTCASGNSSQEYSGIQFPTIDWDKTYWWRVRVSDGEDLSLWSSLNSFSTPKHPFPTVSFSFNPSAPDVAEEVSFIQDSDCYTNADPYTSVLCGQGGTKITHIGWDFYRITSTQPNPPNAGGELLDVNIDNGDGVPLGDSYEYTYYSAKTYRVYLEVTDQDGRTCSLVEGVDVGGMKYPWWREILPK